MLPISFIFSYVYILKCFKLFFNKISMHISPSPAVITNIFLFLVFTCYKSEFIYDNLTI